MQDSACFNVSVQACDHMDVSVFVCARSSAGLLSKWIKPNFISKDCVFEGPVLKLFLDCRAPQSVSLIILHSLLLKVLIDASFYHSNSRILPIYLQSCLLISAPLEKKVDPLGSVF